MDSFILLIDTKTKIEISQPPKHTNLGMINLELAKKTPHPNITPTINRNQVSTET